MNVYQLFNNYIGKVSVNQDLWSLQMNVYQLFNNYIGEVSVSQDLWSLQNECFINHSII